MSDNFIPWSSDGRFLTRAACSTNSLLILTDINGGGGVFARINGGERERDVEREYHEEDEAIEVESGLEVMSSL